MLRRKKDGNWHSRSQNMFMASLHFASQRIPIPEGEALALWFAELPSVAFAEFKTVGAEDHFTVKTTTGHRYFFSGAVRPQVLLEGLILLTRLLQDQMDDGSEFKAVNSEVYFSLKKRRRRRRRVDG